MNNKKVNGEDCDVSDLTTIKLCDIIIAYRYLGLYKEIYLICMEELAKRRVAGDSFDFENYINDNLSDMPEIKFDLTDFNAAVGQLRKLTK